MIPCSPMLTGFTVMIEAARESKRRSEHGNPHVFYQFTQMDLFGCILIVDFHGCLG